MEKKSVLVVGGGLAGLSSAMRLAQRGIHVELVSITHVKRSHSVCAQGGINAAFNTKDEGDSPLIHAYETIKGGDFLADQPPVVAMCLSAPGIINMFDRLGCPFNRTHAGTLDVRRFGGSLFHRTVFCGASTGQQLLYTLDEQVRRFETKGLVVKHEHHEFVRLVQNSQGAVCGAILLDHFNQKLFSLEVDAVVLATGGVGVLFGKSTNSIICTGAAAGRMYEQGIHYANPEFIQIHPTTIPGEDKCRLMSESARGEGARIWVFGDASKSITTPDGRSIPCGITGQPWYFLEELYPAYKNLVPRDIACREIMRITALGLGIDKKPQVFLDTTEMETTTQHKLENIFDIYEKFTGEDPRKVPMRIFPSVHYTMGGAWVDWPAYEDTDTKHRYRQMTNIPGCFCIGEADYLYHGANRLGANSLLSCVFSGLVVGDEMPRYLETERPIRGTEQEYKNAFQKEESKTKELLQRNGLENIHILHEELGKIMTENVTVFRQNKSLQATLEKIEEIRERSKKIRLHDSSRFANQEFIFANQFDAMLSLATITTRGALLRNESRGSHFKEEFPERNDTEWLKNTVFLRKDNKDIVFYKEVDTRYLDSQKREYAEKTTSIPIFKNLPAHFPLPVEETFHG